MSGNLFKRFYSEPKRRRVFRVAVVYAVVAWSVVCARDAAAALRGVG